MSSRFVTPRSPRSPNVRHRPSHSRPAPLVDAGRPLLLPARHRARQHDPQRRAPDAAGGPRRECIPAAVDRRLLHARLRRRPAHRRRARRPLRPQEGAHLRPDRLRPRLRPLGARRLVGHADRDPRAHGHRRRVHHALDALHPHQRLPRARARQGDRHLGRRQRPRHRDRPGDRRLARRARRLEPRVPRQPAVRPRRAGRPGASSCPSRATPPRRGWTSAASCSPASASARSSASIIEAPDRGWTSPLILTGFALAASRSPRSWPGSSARGRRCSTSGCSATAASPRRAGRSRSRSSPSSGRSSSSRSTCRWSWATPRSRAASGSCPSPPA